jgi:PAS domain S-box-containing protein
MEIGNDNAKATNGGWLGARSGGDTLSQALRVLIVEDSEDDTLLVLHELKRGGFDCIWKRVDSTAAMSEALDNAQWDLVISDYSMPQFNGLDALRVLQSKGRDIPFILTSGVIGEDLAVEAMKAGAHDYVLKGKLARLTPAVRRELHEAHVRQARRQSETHLRDSMNFLEQILNTSPNLIFICDLTEGRNIYVNREVTRILGYTPRMVQEMGDKLLTAIVHPEDIRRVLEHLADISHARDGEIHEIECRIKRADGQWRWLCSRDVAFARSPDGTVTRMLGTAMDIDDRKRAANGNKPEPREKPL